jgi:hypothetical protein
VKDLLPDVLIVAVLVRFHDALPLSDLLAERLPRLGQLTHPGRRLILVLLLGQHVQLGPLLACHLLGVGRPQRLDPHLRVPAAQLGDRGHGQSALWLGRRLPGPAVFHQPARMLSCIR